MPCYTSNDDDLRREVKNKNLMLEAMLCAMCNNYGHLMMSDNHVKDSSGADMQRELITWWKQHQFEDAKKVSRKLRK